MSAFPKSPYVPEKRVRLALIGGESAPFLAFLGGLGVETIVLPPIGTDDPGVKNHADLSVFHAGCGVFFCSEAAADTVRSLRPQAVHVVPVGAAYPEDCALNLAFLGEDVFGAGEGSASLPWLFLQKKGVRRHSVRQGYANCSVCPVGRKAMITDDPSIFAAAKAAGLDALLIRKGDVRLPGHDYGFIGGASAMIGPREFVFFGDLSTHRDCEQMISFLAAHRCDYHDLPGVPLTDIGGIVPVK
ncbi:MAG: hypothetical protein IJL00_08080 [Clostridia bacterium]|nr:hypothetical protein [Clostridia bacterium]